MGALKAGVKGLLRWQEGQEGLEGLIRLNLISNLPI